MDRAGVEPACGSRGSRLPVPWHTRPPIQSPTGRFEPPCARSTAGCISRCATVGRGRLRRPDGIWLRPPRPGGIGRYHHRSGFPFSPRPNNDCGHRRRSAVARIRFSDSKATSTPGLPPDCPVPFPPGRRGKRTTATGVREWTWASDDAIAAGLFPGTRFRVLAVRAFRRGVFLLPVPRFHTGRFERFCHRLQQAEHVSDSY